MTALRPYSVEKVIGAMRASSAVMKALNIIYEEHESRNIAHFYSVSAAITVGKERPIGERGAVMTDNMALDEARVKLLEKKQRRKTDRIARRA